MTSGWSMKGAGTHEKAGGLRNGISCRGGVR